MLQVAEAPPCVEVSWRVVVKTEGKPENVRSLGSFHTEKECQLILYSSTPLVRTCNGPFKRSHLHIFNHFIEQTEATCIIFGRKKLPWPQISQALNAQIS